MSSHETPPITTKPILYIIDGRFRTNIRLVDDRVMDTIMKIVLRQLKYSRSVLLPPVSFFSAKRKLLAFSENYLSILLERLNVNVEDPNMHRAEIREITSSRPPTSISPTLNQAEGPLSRTVNWRSNPLNLLQQSNSIFGSNGHAVRIRSSRL